MSTTTPETEESVKINLGQPFRVGVGRHTDNVYILQGALTVEETNGTILSWLPGFAVGDVVRIKPRAVHGLAGMTGEVECIYLAVNAQHLHVYGVKTMGTLVFVEENDLLPTVTPSNDTIYDRRWSVTPTCSHPELRFDTLGLRCALCGYVFPSKAPVVIASGT